MTLVSYGSENPDCVKVEQPDAALSSAHSTTKRWRKLALITAGTALCVGSALATYQGWSSYVTDATVAANRASAPSGMFLESQYTSEVKPDVTLLTSGQEIMLRVRGKNNLCVDDGGGWTAASSKFTNKPCNPNSPNQVFKYISTSKQFASVYKTGLCIDDGGSTTASGSKAQLNKCDANSQNQWFVMNTKTLMLKNPAKNNLCFDDGGGATTGSTKYVLWTCDNNNPNQHFEVLSRAAMAAEKKQKAGTTMYDLMVSGQEIMLRVRGKTNLCVDDGGSFTASTTKFTDMPCNPNSVNQVFKYNIKTGGLESINKPGLCIDDGGALSAGAATSRLWYCDINNQNQWFDMDESTLMMKNPVKDNLCLDDGGGTRAGATKVTMGSCDNNSPNQHFEVLSRAALLEEKKKTGSTPYDLLLSGQEVMFRVRGKSNLCVDDGGGWSAAVSTFVDKPCNPNSPNQVFKYNIRTLEFENVNKPGLCIDDGGSLSSAGSTARLGYCDANNQNQWYVLDESTLMLRNPMKDNLCFDDGGGTAAGASKFATRTCDNNSPNQHFEILSHVAMIEEKKKSVGTTAYDVLTSGQEVMLRVRGKANLCMDDGGGWSAGATNFIGQLCDPDSPNQIFKYNLQTREFENVNKPGLCIDDGGSWKAGGSQAHLWYCDPNNQNQWLVLDEDTLMLHNPTKPDLCLDDGGGAFPGDTNFVLSNCGEDNPNQHFEIISRTDFVEARRQKRIEAGIDDDVELLNSGGKIMLRVHGKNNLCVDDGGGRSNGATKFVDRACNPSSPNQVFTYDAKTRQFKSVNKPGLCLDDGGSSSSGSAQAQLWECDANNQNQWFVLDEETMMLRNPAKKNLCLDDGGGTAPGATKFWLWTCDPNNVNQHFEVLSYEKMAEEQKQRLIAAGRNSDVEILNSGESIMLRVRGKENLCVDDGGGRSNGATKFVDQPCNPNSMNQLFTYDPNTYQFKSANKPGLCMDDGGGWGAGQTTAHLWECDPTNQNQWFVLDEDTMTLYSPAKDNLCFDDGGGTTPGSTKYWLWTCDGNNPNQRFEILSAAALAAEKKKARIAAGNTAVDILVSGQEIMLRVRGKSDLCIDDGGGHLNGETDFENQLCDPDSPNQIFTYNPMTHQFQSANKPGMCIDDGGGWSSAETAVHLWECDPYNPNQWFVMDEGTLVIFNPAKDNLCFDDGGGMTPGETKYVLWTCDDNNPNQHFEVLPRASMIAEKRKRLIAAGVDDDIDLLNSGQPLMLRVRGKDNLCADDGGGHSNGDTNFVNMPCDPNSPNQIFTYDAKTHQFRSVNKPGLCLDDGGGWSAAQTTAHLWDCDPNNQNQWFILDEDNMMLRNPVKPNLCFDDGGGMTPGTSKYWLWTCDTANTNQHFEIVSPALMPPLVLKDASAVSDGQTLDNPDAQYIKTIESGIKVLIRAHQKKNLCLDDGGGRSNAETKFVYQPCDPNSPNQIFSYDVDAKEFQSVNKPGLCLDDGGGWNAGDSTAHLWQCDSGNENQWFVTDPDTMLFHNPAKPGLCFDDTGATEPGKSNFIMWYCNSDTPNQQFEVVPQWELLGITPDVAPPPLPKIGDGLWSTIDNGNDVLPPPALSDVLPPVVVDNNGGVVGPTPPNAEDGGFDYSNVVVLRNDDNVITPQVDSSGFGSTGGKGAMTTTSVSDGGIVATPEPQPYNPATPSLIDGDSVQPTYTNPGWNYGGSTGNAVAMEPTDNQNPGLEYTPTTQRPIIEDGGIVAIPPSNDAVVSVQSTDATTAGWGDTHADSSGPAQDIFSGTSNPDTASTPAVDSPTNPDQVGLVGPAVLPFQEDNNLPIPNAPVIRKADLPLANYGDCDWNLLAPSNDTLLIINKDDSPIISAAKIFKYLQTIKEHADVEHQVTMDRYKRTFQCATDGLKTLAKDAVTSDEYHVLVQWMYDHCAAGATGVKPAENPSGSISDDVLKGDDVAVLVNDDKINRQFMTKLDFYYEIKNHYADKNAELVGNAAVANLRSSETLKLEKKLVDCIEEASERFGYKQDQTSNEDPEDRLKQAIAWVHDTCMAS